MNDEARVDESMGQGDPQPRQPRDSAPLPGELMDEFRDIRDQADAINNTLRAAMDANMHQQAGLRRRRTKFWRTCAEELGIDPDAVEEGQVALRIDTENGRIKVVTEDERE